MGAIRHNAGIQGEMVRKTTGFGWKMFASSQLCSMCGYQNKDAKNLNWRELGYLECQTHHDQGSNTGQNLKNEPLRLLTTGTTGSASSITDGYVGVLRNPGFKQLL